MSAGEAKQEELTEEQLEQASNLGQFFEKGIVQRLQSPEWYQREQALQEIGQNIASYAHKEGFASAINQLVIMCMDQKVSQIINQTVNIIEGVLMTQKDFKFDSHERVLAYLADKLIDQKLS